MSWVSYSKLQELCNTFRTKFTSNEIVIANVGKSKGVHLNVGGQDGLITMSPITEDGVTPAALWVTDSNANNATELTGGTLSYVTDVGTANEDYTSLSLVGDVVNVSGKGGTSRRITNVAAPINDNDAVNKTYVDNIINGGNNMYYRYKILPPDGYEIGLETFSRGENFILCNSNVSFANTVGFSDNYGLDNFSYANCPFLLSENSKKTLRGQQTAASITTYYYGTDYVYLYVPNEIVNTIKKYPEYVAYCSAKFTLFLNTKNDYTSENKISAKITLSDSEMIQMTLG